MSTTRTLSLLSIAAAAALALSACSKDDPRTAGEKLDAAVAKTENAAAEAKAEIKQESAEAKAAMERSADKANASLNDTADKTSAAISNAADKTSAAMNNAADKVAAKSSDALITTSVNAELAKDSSLSALKIDVDTRDGKVMLTGTAPSSVARDRATTLAKSVKGVVSVENRLDVRG